MMEDSGSSETPYEQNKVGPDWFGYYIHEVADLLSLDDGILASSSIRSELIVQDKLHVSDKDVSRHDCSGKEVIGSAGSGSLFSDAAGACLSDVKKERLKVLLRESLAALTREVDEVFEPVNNMQRIYTLLREKKCTSGNFDVTSENVAVEHHPMKQRIVSSSASASVSNPLHDGVSSSIAEEENEEVKDDLQIILENSGSKVEEKMKKYSEELSITLRHMEQKLETLLDIVMSSCRVMTRAERHELRRLIQKLPPNNLDRAAEIIRSRKEVVHRRKPSEKSSCHEIHVDLEDEDNVMLWRVYYYIEAVENARKLLSVA